MGFHNQRRGTNDLIFHAWNSTWNGASQLRISEHVWLWRTGDPWHDGMWLKCWWGFQGTRICQYELYTSSIWNSYIYPCSVLPWSMIWLDNTTKLICTPLDEVKFSILCLARGCKNDRIVCVEWTVQIVESSNLSMICRGLDIWINEEGEESIATANDSFGVAHTVSHRFQKSGTMSFCVQQFQEFLLVDLINAFWSMITAFDS